MASNNSLNAAKEAKNDEFYTQLVDIAKELSNYTEFFNGKTVLCNCDDPEWSNFWIYFHQNFEDLGLRKLISTHYNTDGSPSYKMEYEGGNDVDVKCWKQTSLQGNGDFRSDECIDILKEADICVTNPPFSLFREFIAQLIEYDKQFIVIGCQNAITYKEIFPLLKENKMWLGYHSGDMAFTVPEYYEERETRFWIDENGQKWRSMGNICWFTNINIPKRSDSLIDNLQYQYARHLDWYQKYDNHTAINIGKVDKIPYDYMGIMGVPITFLNKYNPDEFEILNCSAYSDPDCYGCGSLKINKKKVFARILIKRKVNNNENNTEEN